MIIRPALVVDGMAWYFEENEDATFTLVPDSEPTDEQRQALEDFARSHLILKDQIDNLLTRLDRIEVTTRRRENPHT